MIKFLLHRLLILSLVLSVLTVRSQQLDKTFHSPVAVRASQIMSMVAQPDGKILLGGEIAYHGSKPVNNLIRIAPDGTLDATFAAKLPPGYSVEDIKIMETGDVAVLSWFHTEFATSSRVFILNTVGHVIRESGVMEYSQHIAVLPNGRLLVGGAPNSGTVQRLNEDLSIDPTFKITFNGTVTDVKVQGNGIYLSGTFDKVNGEVKNDIVKLNLDGSIHHTFDTGAGTPEYVATITVLPDGKVFPGNTFIATFDGVRRGGSVRLNSDGSVDESFASFWNFNGGINEVVATENYVYMASFVKIDGVSANYLLRFNQDGSWDRSFKPVDFQFDPIYYVHTIASGNELIVSGPSKFGNVYGIIKTDQSGNIQPDFQPKIGRLGVLSAGERVEDKLMVAGDFVKIDSLETFGLARLGQDGFVDESFALKENFGPVYQMSQVDDSNTLLTTYRNFFKVDNKGNRIESFNWTPRAPLHQVVKFDLLADGKIIVADPNTLVRLNSDGSYDESFSIPEDDGASTAFDFDFQGENIIYGFFGIRDEQHGDAEAAVRRIKPDGSYDASFSKDGPDIAGESTWTSIGLVKVLDNGEILVGGSFKQYGGIKVEHGLVKLSADGKVDVSFNENQRRSSGPQQYSESSVEQLGDKIYIKTKYNIALVNLDGTGLGMTMPVNVDLISDIIAIPSDAAPGGRGAGSDDQLIAIGSFYDAVSKSRGSMVRLNLNRQAEPTEPEVVTSIDNNKELSIDIFPNPAADKLRIRMGDSVSAFQACIYGTAGAKVIDQHFDTADAEGNVVDISRIPPGVYLIKVINETGRTSTTRFIRKP